MSASGGRTRTLDMHALPGGDSWLYTMIRTHLGLRNRREVFVLGLRLIHAVGPDPVLRLILLNVASEVLVTDLDHLDWRPKDEPPHDEPFPSGIARAPQDAQESGGGVASIFFCGWEGCD